ncbi:hypothetical protein NDI56_10070 [Haloarcula sp. S1CR25-12]|uniref:Uncharacterized protein n=1 Tax=Haloarcula saliterrae TaxID=2950534 RepID=A0ABU2FBU7_9EURY|nr:hypothetical protein [Haloarcula sp. S1CR25-12]MDS0259738.1 hypothetical protein [Haloarcula sp. S1CR25-12]
MLPQFFDDSETGARRSVLFAITVATGALCLASATSVVVSGASLVYAALLGALGVGVLVFGGYLQQGHFEALVADDQLLWRRG